MPLRLISRDDPLRRDAEDHIRRVYREHFGALVPVFSDSLVVRTDEAGGVCCAAGLRWGREPFFLERYFDGAAEAAASRTLGRPVDRRELFEVSTLACGDPGKAIPFVFDVMERARLSGYTAVMFTATGRLRRLLARYGVASRTVCPADPGRLGAVGHWGSYYALDPHVCVAQDETPPPAPGPASAAISQSRYLRRSWA